MLDAPSSSNQHSKLSGILPMRTVSCSSSHRNTSRLLESAHMLINRCIGLKASLMTLYIVPQVRNAPQYSLDRPGGVGCISRISHHRLHDNWWVANRETRPAKRSTRCTVMEDLTSHGASRLTWMPLAANGPRIGRKSTRPAPLLAVCIGFRGMTNMRRSR